MNFEFEQTKIQTFSEFEDFYKYLTKVSLKSRLINNKDEPCSFCLQEIKVGVMISRKCQCEAYPCEKFQCTQSQLPCCFKCLVQHLWNSSKGKGIGRFRAKCPFCQSEFCLHDMVQLK